VVIKVKVSWCLHIWYSRLRDAMMTSHTTFLRNVDNEQSTRPNIAEDLNLQILFISTRQLIEMSAS
jgi:hypothetical protein